MVHQKLLIATAIIAAVVITACSDSTAPKQVVPSLAAAEVAAMEVTPSLSESFPRSGDLHITKECSQYTRLAGGFCTITSSNIREIEAGTRVVLDPPGPGNNTAFGHVVLDLAARQGVVTVSGGTGKFTWFHASVAVTHLTGPNWAWDGTYSFDPRD